MGRTGGVSIPGKKTLWGVPKEERVGSVMEVKEAYCDGCWSAHSRGNVAWDESEEVAGDILHLSGRPWGPRNGLYRGVT